MFVASLAFPDVAFPLVWIGVFLFLDPINALTGGRSIAAQVAVGRWDTELILFRRRDEYLRFGEGVS
jgi:hypothetical protein